MQRKEFLAAMALTSGAMTLGASLEAIASTFPEDGRLMPSFFFGHGSPMNAIEENIFVKGWRDAVADLPTPKAILCVSAHWLTRGTMVTAMERPKTIHDFGGFPKKLFEATYAAPGDPKLAALVKETVKSTEVGLNLDWGFDHGTWSVLKPIFPDAKIPVIQVSIDLARPGAWHYELGKELREFRKRGILVIGSGNMVHNLGLVDFSMTRSGFGWANEINDLFKQHILKGDHQPLLDYKALGKAASLAIPTPDHYYPLLYALGTQGADEPVSLFNDQAIMGSLTMTSVRIG